MKNIKQLLLFVTLLVLLIGIASASEVNADTTTSTNDVQTVADDSTAVSHDIVTQEKQIMKNDNKDTPVKKAARLLEMGHYVFFSPEDLKIVKNGPAERRRFMDLEICQL
ncbi:MAG: hypothetical protein IKF79_07290, partial [Methanosphaera sp.]|nr:hypothetical protein [Methanosphaera sp.]